MKQRIVLFFIISLVFHFNAIAQCIIVNSKPGNCMSCMKAMSLLDYKNYPVYFVFEENEVAYRNEIEQQFEGYGIKIVFSDYLFKLTAVNSSPMPRLALLDENANSVFNIAIDELDESFVNKNIDNYFANRKRQTNLSSRDGLYYGDKYKYIFNHSFGILNIYNRESDKLIKTLTVDSIGLSKRVMHLNSKDSADVTNSFLKVKFDFNTKPKFNFFLQDETTKKLYLTFNTYYLDPDDTSYISSINYLVVMDSILDYELYKIETPNWYLNYTNMLLPVNDTTILLSLYNDSLEAEISKKQSIKMPIFAKYHLVKSKLKFQEFYDVDLPSIYKQRFKHNYLGLYPSHYPYVALLFSNTIVNLENNIKVELLTDSVYTNSLNHAKFDYFKVKKLVYNDIKNQLLCFYSLGDMTFVNKYNDNLKLIESYLLNPSHFTDSPAYNYNEVSRIISVTYNDSRFFLPVDIF